MYIYKAVDTKKASFQKDIFSLYKSVNWTNYFKKKEHLLKGINHSLCIVGAYKAQELIGLIRVVGDGYTIIYIQDVLVKPKYQRQGIGKELVEIVLKKYKQVRQKVLLTDQAEHLKVLYTQLGFTSSINQKLNCFVLLNT